MDSYKGDLKKGMRVKAIDKDGIETYRGTIFDVYGNVRLQATIQRDDEIEGSGLSIEGYGNGWRISKKIRGWNDGEYNIIPLEEKITNWKKVISNEI